MATTLRRPHATPSARLLLRRELAESVAALTTIAAMSWHVLTRTLGTRLPSAVASVFGARGLRLLLNAATAALVLALPFTAAAVPQQLAAAAPPPDTATAAAISSVVDESPRADTRARSMSAQVRSVVTIAAAEGQPVRHHTVEGGDTLEGIAKYYGVELDDLAYANGIKDESTLLHVGEDIVVPPGRGALYTVRDGDTVTSVAQRFKVETATVMTYNRLYFEPQNFAPGKTIFVPNAQVPAMKRMVVSRTYVPTGQLPARTGRLAWPVNGVITQNFWWGHTGVDIAAPYGTPIGASDDGVVVATGWVAVGGLRVCVQHADGFKTCYYHTSAVFVSPGEVVKRGQKIAAIGLTGVTTGPHVHWEVWHNGVQVNGLDY